MTRECSSPHQKEGKETPCLQRLVNVLTQTNTEIHVEYFHSFVDYKKDTNLAVSSFSKMSTYILYCGNVNGSNVCRNLQFVSQLASSVKSDGLKMILLVHASQRYAQDLSEDEKDYLLSEMSVLSAVIFSHDDNNGTIIHLNYPNDDEYGTSVSCVNVYLLHAVLLFTKQDKMKLLKSGCEGSDSIFFQVQLLLSIQMIQKFVAKGNAGWLLFYNVLRWANN